MDYINLKNKVKNNLKTKRFEHTLRVVETALVINESYKLEVSKIKVASLLHDYAKNYNNDEIDEIIQKYDLQIDKFTMMNKELIHSHLGAELAKRELDIQDDDILNSIRYHTTGRANMSELEMIVYLADFCEPERKIVNVQEVRKLSRNSLYDAMLLAQNTSLEYLVNSNRPIDIRSIECRNWLLSIIYRGEL